MQILKKMMIMASGLTNYLLGFAGKNIKKVDIICMNCGKKFRY